MNNLAVFNYKGQTITRQSDDGYVNLTQMCQANGKRLDNWLRLKSTVSYLATLSNSLGSEVVYSVEGANGGTWGHPSVAINLARWISDDFAIWCDGHIFNLMSTGSTTIKSVEQKSPEWTQARLQGKDERRKLTDAIKEYIDRHPELSDNQKKFLYCNASESLNLSLFAKRSKQLKALLGLSTNALLRDGLTLRENSCLASLEFLACQLIEHEDLDPCAAVKKAIDTSYSHKMFAEKYLNNDALPPAKD